MQYVLPVDPQLLAPVRTDCASRRPQVEQSFTENTTDDDNENPPVTRTTHFFPTFCVGMTRNFLTASIQKKKVLRFTAATFY